MKRLTEINVFGVGRVARQAVAEAARRHADIRFRLFSRNPRSHQPFPWPNVRLCGLDGLRKDGAPLVLCMASDESRVLQAFRDRPGGVTPRSAVAASNLRLLREVIEPRLWCHRLVVVVTNPVELVCEFLFQYTGNPRVYGFGMASDRERVLEAIRQGFRRPREEASGVEVTGFHILRPIALLSGVPDLIGKLESVATAEVANNLARCRPVYGATPTVVVRHFSRGLEALSAPWSTPSRLPSFEGLSHQCGAAAPTSHASFPGSSKGNGCRSPVLYLRDICSGGRSIWPTGRLAFPRWGPPSRAS
jgi:hypothetical protein